MDQPTRKNTLERLMKKLAESFVDDVRVSDEKTLRDKIVQLSKEIEDIEEAKKTDANLNSLREQVKDLAGAYKDAKKEKTDRLKYIILTLTERGKI